MAHKKSTGLHFSIAQLRNPAKGGISRHSTTVGHFAFAHARQPGLTVGAPRPAQPAPPAPPAPPEPPVPLALLEVALDMAVTSALDDASAPPEELDVVPPSIAPPPPLAASSTGAYRGHAASASPRPTIRSARGDPITRRQRPAPPRRSALQLA